MKNVKSMKLKEVQRILERAGFHLAGGTKHLMYKNESNGRQIFIPHHSKDVSKKFIMDVMKVVS